MPSQYSDRLIADTITCFKEEDGIVVSREEAIRALDALGGLFLAFAEDSGSVPRFSAGADLISVPLNKSERDS